MATVEVPQHLAALERAQANRLDAIEARRDLKARRLTLAQALTDTRAGAAQIADLLAAQWHWDRDRAARRLVELGIPQATRVRDLTANQRWALTSDEAGGQRSLLSPSLIVREQIGRYVTTSGEVRIVALVAEHDGRVLYDAGRNGRRVIERFAASEGLLEIAAVARGYLDERAREAGRDVA